LSGAWFIRWDIALVFTVKIYLASLISSFPVRGKRYLSTDVFGTDMKDAPERRAPRQGGNFGNQNSPGMSKEIFEQP
jgi:hypothetical protein